MSFCKKYHKFVGVFLCLAFAALSAFGREVRVASYNVLYGIGTTDSLEFKAAGIVIKRINADVITFQELNKKTIPHWEKMADQLGYYYKTVGEKGPFSGSHFVGYFSRFKILESTTVKSPEGAKELSRPPVRVVLDVPFAKKPLVVWGVHLKSGINDSDAFRRAVEARRILIDVKNYLKKNPKHDEFVILGDFNDDMSHVDQVEKFLYLPRGLPKTMKLAKDIKLPLPYKIFPNDHFSKAGSGMQQIALYQTGTDDVQITLPKMKSILDYIFISKTLAAHPKSLKVGEVYNSKLDGKNVGLKKWPCNVHPVVSSYASDHLPVFVDIHMEDEE